MGAALCTCGSPDDQGFSGLRFDRLSSLHTSRAAAVVGSYGVFPHAKYRPEAPLHHTSQLLSRGETYALSDDDEDEGAEDGYSRRYGSAQAYADAFRAKLQEPPLSPHSKFTLLSSRYSSASPTESSRGGDSGSAFDENAVTGGGGAAGRKKGRHREEAAWHSNLMVSDDVDHAIFDHDPNENALVTEDEWKQRANPLVTIIVPPGPCGLVLQLDRDDLGAPVVDGFVRKYDGKKSTIENSQLVHKGSVLCAINDIDVTRMPLKEVLRTLKLSSHLERAFTFRNRFQHRNSM